MIVGAFNFIIPKIFIRRAGGLGTHITAKQLYFFQYLLMRLQWVRSEIKKKKINLILMISRTYGSPHPIYAPVPVVDRHLYTI